MDQKSFEEIVNRAFDSLPDTFKNNIDNVQFVIEDYPTPEQITKVKLSSKKHLLGLYEGVPLKFRNTWYGRSGTVPDRISLFQKNIETISSDEIILEKKIREVLLHEIGHYFGMTEEEIRNAGY